MGIAMSKTFIGKLTIEEQESRAEIATDIIKGIMLGALEAESGNFKKCIKDAEIII